MNLRKLLPIALIVSALPPVALANDAVQFSEGEPIAIDSEKAYFAFRMTGTPDKYALSLVLVKLLSQEEYRVAAASRQNDRSLSPPSNILFNRNDAPYSVDNGQYLFIISGPPGRYALAGLASVNKNSGPILTCLCMGTVAFEARAGMITDLGTVLFASDREPSAIPELRDLVRGYDIGIRPFPYVAGLRLAENSVSLPPAISALPVRDADYRVFGKFPNVIGGSIERLAPIKGVLDYDGDRVIDLKSETPDE